MTKVYFLRESLLVTAIAFIGVGSAMMATSLAFVGIGVALLAGRRKARPVVVTPVIDVTQQPAAQIQTAKSRAA